LNVKDDKLLQKLKEVYGRKSVRLWGLKIKQRNQWERIKEGDLFLSYNNKRFIFKGVVAFKYPFMLKDDTFKLSESMAKLVWGRDLRGDTWPLLIFLVEVKPLDLSLEKFNELTGYKLRAVQGFMIVREEKARKLLEEIGRYHLSKVDLVTSIKKPKEKPLHNTLVDELYSIGELIGYRPFKNWKYENFIYDVVWFKPKGKVPKCIFEVQIGGNITEALARLKHAYDLWNSSIFLVAPSDQLDKARALLAGAFHEIEEEISLLDIEDVEKFYKFKSRFEWLERKFGLKIK